MRQFKLAIVLPVFIVALFGLLAARGTTIGAQSTTPAVQAEHPVVGAWQKENDAPGPGVNTAYATFHADGTYLEVDPNIGVGLGTWQATGARTADLIAVYQDIDSDPATVMAGTVTVRQSVTVDETGNVLTAPFTVDVRIPDGTVVFSARYTARGTRLQVEPMATLATPGVARSTSATPTG